MKRIGAFLCGIMVTALLTGCGAMPDLTQEETELISEYAVGVLLKYDTSNSRRLVDTSAYDETAETEETVEETTEEPAEEPEEEETETAQADDTEIIDVSQDEETMPATIEAYYGIQDVVFQYTGYELVDSYPSAETEGDMFFTMDATEGTELLVLKFNAANTSGSDVTLNMLQHGARFRVSVNGEASKGALATMLVNDMQTYDEILPAGSLVELVSIVEVPQGVSIDSIEFVLRGNGENAVITLE